MCANCETRALCDRLDKQIKNLEAGGSVNPDALAKIIREARDGLARHANTATVVAALLRGELAAAVVTVGNPGDAGGHTGGVH